jgi:hypothetical protein
MGCCGDGGRRRPLALPPSTGGATARVRYLGRRARLVHGPASGRIYRFAGPRDVQAVHREDLASLLRAGLVEPA